MHKQTYIRGVREGIPVGLGYFVVSFTIGIAARKANLTPLQATVMSFTKMAISQAVINLRYCLMSCALSQKLDAKLPFYHRFFLAFGVTDEIFGLSVSQKGKLDPWYTYGVMSVAVPGWSLGTLTGVLSTGMLPQTFLNAMNMALYGMFIAIFMPAAREDKKLLPIIFISMALSTLFQVVSWFDFISSGMKIIILTLAISMGAAIFMPLPEEKEEM